MRGILVRTLETLSDGLVAGAVAAAIGVALHFATGRRRLPITGYLVVAAYMVVIRDRIDPVLAVGLLVLTVPSMVPARGDLLSGVLLGLPGAAIIGFGTTPGPVWLDASVTAAIAVGGALTTDFAEKHYRLGLGTLFMGLATVGGWLDIPDVDRILVLLGAAIPVAVLAWPKPILRLGPSAHVWVGALMWTAVDGGAIRLSAVVGTFAALGLNLIEPLVRRRLGWERGVFAQLWGAASPWAAIAPVFAQAGMVLLASRLAGIRSSTEAAIVIAAIVLATGFGVLLWYANANDPAEFGLD